MEENRNNEIEVNSKAKQTNEQQVQSKRKLRVIDILVVIVVMLLLMLALSISNMYAMTKEYDNVFSMVASMISGKEDESVENNLQSNEENDLNNSEEIVTKTIKENSNKDYVYLRESYDVEINDRGDIFKDKIEIPYINIDSEDAKKVNQEIYKMYEEAVKTVVEEEQENSYTAISYKYSIVDNIISLCIDSTPICIPGGGFTAERTVYNFSLENGKRLSTKEVLAKHNLSEESMIEKINLDLKDWYIDTISSGVLGDITENDFYKSFDYNFNAIYFETNTIAEVYFFENPFHGGMSRKINIFLDTDVKKVIQGFLNIERNYFGSPSAVLTIDEFGYVDNITEYEKNYSKTSDGWLVSNNIKYSDFKNKMLGYMTEELYQKEFNLYKDINGFLAVNEQIGKPGNEAKVESIELVDTENNIYTYLVETTNYHYNQQGTKAKEKFELKKNENGKYVVSNWGWQMEVKEALQNYLDLLGAYQGSPVNLLVKLNLIKSADIDYTDKNNDKDGYVKTNIKYSEYKQKMLNYVSESWFNESFTSLYKEKGGYLCYFNGGGTGMKIKVESIGSFLNDKYTATVYNIGVDGDKSDTYIKKFDVEYKEKYVISYCD